MPTYDMGTAHGRIRIDYEGDGFQQAESGFQRVRQEAGETDSSLIGITKTLGRLVTQMSVTVAKMPAVAAGMGAIVASTGAAGLALGAFGLAVLGQTKQISESSEAADKLANAEIDAANKAAVAAKLRASGHKLAEKATKASESAQLSLIQAQHAYTAQTRGMPAATAATALEFSRLKLAFESWSNSLAPTTMPIFTRGLALIRQILPTLTPLVQVASDVISQLMTDMERGVSGGGMASFMTRMAQAAQTTLPNLINSIRNVIVGISGLFGGLNKNGTDVTQTLEEVTGRFAAWGQAIPNDPGFAKFMAQMNEGGGMTVDILGDLILTVKNLIIAFGPFAGATLLIAQVMADFVQSIPVDVLRILIGLVIAANVALKLYAATQAIVTAATKAWAVAQRILNLAFLTNPVFLIIAGIVALVAVIVLIATKTTWFQTIWDKVWGFIKAAASKAWDFIKAVVQKGFNFLKFIFLNFTGPGLIIKHWNTIKKAVSSAVSFVVDFVKNNWKKILALLTGPIGIAVALIIKHWDKIKGAFSTAGRAVSNMVRGLGSSISGGFSRVINTLVNLRNRVFSIFSGAHKWLINAGKNIISGLIDGIQRMFRKLQDVLGSVTNVIPDWKGPESRDRKLLVNNGQLIMGGLIKGFTDYLPKVQAALGGITGNLALDAATTIPAVGTVATQKLLPPISASVGSTISNPVNVGNLVDQMVSALDRAGIGTVYLDGEVISQNVGRRQGAITSAQRRTR